MLMIVECAEYITENRLHLKQSSTRSKPVVRLSTNSYLPYLAPNTVTHSQVN